MNICQVSHFCYGHQHEQHLQNDTEQLGQLYLKYLPTNYMKRTIRGEKRSLHFDLMETRCGD